MTQLATNENSDLVIPENLVKVSADQLAELIGQRLDKPQGGDTLASLSINLAPEDDEGNTLPRGQFALYNPETKEKVFGKDVNFRIFIRRFMPNLGAIDISPVILNLGLMFFRNFIFCEVYFVYRK